jgi:hypothetical protein
MEDTMRVKWEQEKEAVKCPPIHRSMNRSPITRIELDNLNMHEGELARCLLIHNFGHKQISV